MLGLQPERSVKTVLFDFDGTLADTVGVGVVAFNQLAQRYGFSEITPDNAEYLRGKGPRGVMKALSVPIYRLPTVLRTLRAGVRSALPELTFTDGMRSAIVSLKAMGYQLGLVTSNSEENVIGFLENNQMNVFDFIQAGTGIFNKGRKIKKLMSRVDLQVKETVFVGDEIRDVQAAKKSDLRVVGVTWGINSREGLMEAGADFIVDTAPQLVELFS